MPLRNVATTFTIEQQRLEINYLAGDVNNIETGVTNVGTAATANALAAGATGADLTLSGTLTVNGTQTILNTATLEVEDKNIVIAKGSTTDAAASGGGITLKGADDKTLLYDQAGDEWQFNKPLRVEGSQVYTDSASSLETSVTKAAFRVKGSTNSSDSLFIGVENVHANPYLQGNNGIGNNAKPLLLNPYGGNVKLGDNIELNEGKKAIFNSDSGNGAYMKHQSGHLEFKNETGWIYWDTVADIRIRTGASYGTALTVHSDQSCTFGGKIRFDTDNYIECNNIADTMEFTLGGVLVGEFGTSSLKLLDTFRLKLGTGNDLQMYHDNNSSLNLITAANNQEIKISDLKTTFYDYTGVSKYGEIGPDGISDNKGNLRQIPITWHNASTYTLLASDSGKVVSCATNATNITVPASTFVGGDTITIMNHTPNIHTITQGSGVTLYNAADGSTGNRQLATRGLATIFFREHNVAYISGAGLS